MTSLRLAGLTIIAAVLAGGRDPRRLAAPRHEKCHAREDEIARAPEGTWRPEHPLAPEQAYGLYRSRHRRATGCDQRIAAASTPPPSRSGGRPCARRARRRGREGNDVRFDATGPLSRASGADLTEIAGIDVGTAPVIPAEVGADVSRSPTEKRPASRLGLCPRQHESNRTQRRRGP